MSEQPPFSEPPFSEPPLTGRQRLRAEPKSQAARFGMLWLQAGWRDFIQGFWAWLLVNAWFSLFLFLLKPSEQGQVYVLQLPLLLLLPFVLAAAFQLPARLAHKQNFMIQDLLIAFQQARRFLYFALWLLLLVFLLVLAWQFFLVSYANNHFLSPLFLLLTLAIGAYFAAGFLFAPVLTLFQPSLEVIQTWQWAVRGVYVNILPLLLNLLGFVALVFPALLLFSLLLTVLGIDPKVQPGLTSFLLFPINAYILALTYGSAYAAYHDIFLEEDASAENIDQEKTVVF